MIFNSRARVALLASALSLILWACGPAAQAQPTIDVNSAASTLVALTFQVATQAAELNPPTSTPPPATATLEAPALYTNQNVKCRTGAGANFQVVTSFPPGTKVDMVGKDSADGAWLVQVPGSPETCWVLAQDASPSGDFQRLPEMTPQPSSQKPPTQPASINWPFFCEYEQGVTYKVTTDLSWFDAANDANGFRVYRGDTLITDVSVGTTSYTDTTEVTIGSNLTYSVEAYNDAGVSPRRSVTIASICTK